MRARTNRLMLVGLFLIVSGGGTAGSLVLSRRIPSALYTPAYSNFWFQADPERVIAVDTDAHSHFHYRDSVHPLYSLMSYPVVAVIRAAGGTGPLVAARIYHALIAGAWSAALLLVLLLIRLPVSVALPYTLLGMASASSLFWFSIPETYGLGSLTILLVMALAAWKERRPTPTALWVLASAGTLSATVTNWSAGVLASITCLRWRRAVAVTILAGALVGGLSFLQRRLFPSAGLFVFGFLGESQYLSHDVAGSLWPVSRVLLFHAMVMPKLLRLPLPDSNQFLLSVQAAPIGSGTAWGVPAAVLWAWVLIVGAVGGLRRWPLRPMLAVIGSLLAQWIIYVFYGNETFLYAVQFLPFLVLVAAGGAWVAKRPTVVAGWLLVVLVALNNWTMVVHARQMMFEAGPLHRSAAGLVEPSGPVALQGAGWDGGAGSLPSRAVDDR